VVVVQQPLVNQVAAFSPPKSGDAGLLNRQLMRWATPLGLGYGGMGLVLAVLRSLFGGSGWLPSFGRSEDEERDER
jgi:hypothetical protein